jgi:glycosyltransferase involved in cell wall biosynthesis
VTTLCIDCRYIRERPSGIGWYVQALVDHVPGLCPDLELLLLKHPKAPERLSTAPNVREVVVPEEANGPATLLWLPRVVDLRGVDLFHATFNILPAGLRMKSLVTLCDVMWIKYPQWCRTPGPWGLVETAFYRRGIQQALRSATHIAAISEATRQEIGTVDPRALSKTTVTLLGISEDFRPLAGEDGARRIAQAQAKWMPGSERYVLTVGQFAGYKNHEGVVRAFAQAFRHDRGVHLGLVQRLGKGEETLLPIARALGVGDRVRFLPSVPFADLVALYNGALCLCHPSLYEGYGNPPGEALACGCPVVTSNRSSMPEVSTDAAVYVDPTDVDDVAWGLRKIADDPALRARLRERGIARAKELSWRRFAEENVAIYRELLGRPATVHT